MAGFVGSDDTSNMTLVGNTLAFDYLFPIYHVDLVVKSEFVAPNSNSYTLDWIFDPASSQGYINGVPSLLTFYVAFKPMTTQPTWRIQVLSSLGVKESVTADLAPVPDYWLL